MVGEERGGKAEKGQMGGGGERRDDSPITTAVSGIQAAWPLINC